tara:strand:+ start:515 stop:694 length:180 start_codon:yes stop_codon:yes gene_type:complete
LVIINLKQTEMETQKTDLKKEIKELETKLKFATMNCDAFTQMEIYNKLNNAKSLLINIK